jgi:hypothetical protein
LGRVAAGSVHPSTADKRELHRHVRFLPKRTKRAAGMELQVLIVIVPKAPLSETAMKKLIVCTAILGIAFSSAAQAKGCIKGAIVGGVAGSVAGHGKVGAVAGCVIGHHEANKADTEKAKTQSPASPSRGDDKI